MWEQVHESWLKAHGGPPTTEEEKAQYGKLVKNAVGNVDLTVSHKVGLSLFNLSLCLFNLSLQSIQLYLSVSVSRATSWPHCA